MRNIVFCLIIIFSGCSSAPKKETEIFRERNTAVKQLDLANKTASHGRYQDALVIVEDARRLAVGTDDPSLRIKTLISRGNILFALGRLDEAFRDWEDSANEAATSRENILAAQARIYSIRASLVMLASGAGENVIPAVEEYKSRLAAEMTAVRSDPFSAAEGYITLGIAEKEIGRWAEAESAVKRALDFHVRELNFEEAAYAWFLIASIRSVAGNYDSALEALQAAIGYDRRAENGFGLASSWQATGDVLQKAGRPIEAQASWRRAAEIYRAIDMRHLAEIIETQNLAP
jgi:tetratricopeptide (TPR) repeat protein